MEREITSLKGNDVWELVKLSQNRKVVGSKWVFKVKVDANGQVNRYKVVHGFSQIKELDFDETFCLVVWMESLRAVASLAACKVSGTASVRCHHCIFE